MGRARRPFSLAHVKSTLDAVRARQDRAARALRDPIGFVRRYETDVDRELAGLLASTFAFGNVTTILAKLSDVAQRVAGPLASRASELRLPGLVRALRGFRHRLFVGEDVARLLHGARVVQEQRGSLGAVVASHCHGSTPSIQRGLAALVTAIREAGGLLPHPKRRGPSHMLPDVMRGGGSKRLLLFARWMVRPDDGVDLGLWKIPSRLLVIPVDTHIHRLSTNIGFTRSRVVNWKAAEEITNALAELDPNDPVGYDFALCHLGMAQGCPSRKDARLCEGCGVRPICLHWK